MMTAVRFPLAGMITLYQSMALALSQIWANKVRGILTTLGILIGVAAVSAVIALITGMQKRVLAEFEAFGTNRLFIGPQWNDRELRKKSWDTVLFKTHDFDEMLERCPSVERFTRNGGFGSLPIQYRTKSEFQNVQFTGVDPSWHAVERRGATAGRRMVELDSRQSARVCLINKLLRDKLGLDRDPTGQIIDVYFFGRLTVIGMLEPPASLMADNAEAREIVVPFSFATKKFPWPLYYQVSAESKSRETTEEAKGEIEFYLRQKRHIKPGEKNTFAIQTLQRTIDEINEMAAVVATIATGIVGISLLVGGVGIMNIMLVSVSERTREIGLRKAVGAKSSAILLQFLVESVVLCLIGGALGLVAGQGITSGVSRFIPGPHDSWSNYKPGEDPLPELQSRESERILLPPLAIVLAFSFSGAVGVIFGMFPAIKAARLDPIEALRHE
jgi:putative ABC transport system permease protein